MEGQNEKEYPRKGSLTDIIRRIASNENLAKHAHDVSLQTEDDSPRSLLVVNETTNEPTEMRRSRSVAFHFAPDQENDKSEMSRASGNSRSDLSHHRLHEMDEDDHVSAVQRKPSRLSQVDGSEERRPHHKFSIGADTMETLHRPVEIMLNTFRKIASHENVNAVFHRNQSKVSFQEPPGTPRLDRSSSNASSRAYSITISPAQSAEDVQMALHRRADQLQKGVSNPAFSIYLDPDDDAEEGDDRVPPLQRPSRALSTHSLRVPTFNPNNRKFSAGFDAFETIPSPFNYDPLSAGNRPTLDELRFEKAVTADDVVRNTGNETSFKRGKLGWINGVVLWTLQDLWAVQLFLRLAWMNGQAGMGLYAVIVIISTAIALLTSLSISAISTNGEIGIGGTYYMIARSLGPQYGAAIGIIFSLANIINTSLNVQGFADMVHYVMHNFHAQILQHDRINDIRIISIIALVGLTLFALLGVVIASRLKLLCLVLLLAGLANVVVGSFLQGTEQDVADGFTGYSGKVFKENFVPAFQKDKFGPQNFLTVFAVFFPSVTGILAGTAITGDLKDPGSAIPKGTIVATLIASSVYLIIGWISGSVVLRHASGSIDDLHFGNLTACAAARVCEQGSINNMEIMATISHFKPIFIAATLAATISTSLGCIHFAPKVFQALCRDRIFPGFHVFGKGYGHHDEPYRAYLLGFVIAAVFLIPSDINFISNIVSNCFLMSYALVNYATFDASFSRSPGWRPTFKYYNKWLSLATAAACLGFMFALDWMSAIIAFVLVVLVWLFVYYRKPEVNWGTSGQANAYRAALTNTLRLQKIQDHVKNYRPQILVLTGLPCVRPALVYMANSITRGTGLLICGHVMVGEPIRERTVLEQETYKWLWRRKVRAFYEYYAADSTLEGIRALIQSSGLGKLRPNILMMGYHQNWSKMSEASMDEYVQVIHDAFDAHRGVILFYAKEGFDMSEVVNFEKVVAENATIVDATLEINDETDSAERETAVPLEVNETSNPALKERVALAERFEPGKKKKIIGEIHVWWLYDDGGLTLLIPHLLTRQSPWHGCKLKVFCLTGKDGDAAAAKANMTLLLDSFRIKALDIVPVDLAQEPSVASMKSFNELIGQYRYEHAGSKTLARPGVIKESDLIDYGDRTIKQIRLRELLQEHSLNSVLNVVTMPLPKRNRCSTLYMAVLETMTANMPPTLLIRGNQENVLTYYC